MSKLVKVVYDVAGIRGRYLCVHDEIFRLSARKLVRALNPGRQNQVASRIFELDRLSRQILTALAELEGLEENDLSIRRGRDIRNQLADYLAALTESVILLKSICGQLNKRAVKDRTYDQGKLHRLKISYDDAVQHHQRLGAHLNSLISSL
jgi:hypothetical protein